MASHRDKSVLVAYFGVLVESSHGHLESIRFQTLKLPLPFFFVPRFREYFDTFVVVLITATAYFGSKT
ncbi:uncharacterized protein Dyak_GE27711 [Drosophila yakuba]|uniref:Uncharacterized protein n=1 Tax=Drosophila yakuba TaxID=7245 RepID=A0A0R1E911_DROYA|nr:uncharacterized protein Dyak_GE27711 [Drosophila yakuba]